MVLDIILDEHLDDANGSAIALPVLLYRRAKKLSICSKHVGILLGTPLISCPNKQITTARKTSFLAGMGNQAGMKPCSFNIHLQKQSVY